MNYISNTAKQRQEMLKACGVGSVAELFNVIPEKIRAESLDLPQALSELELYRHFKALASENRSDLICFLGGGFYEHFIPAAVDALTMRSEFYTAYTPYQPELSQGTLQAIYEYQSQICRLTGMEVSNASVYEGGNAIYEACQMARNVTGRGRIVVDGGVNPLYRKLLHTHMANLDVDLIEVPVSRGRAVRDHIRKALSDNTAAVVLQNPNFFGVVDNHGDIVEECHKRGVMVIQSVYPVAMAMLRSPGEIGVDIAVGEGQSLGIPLSFGGPYLGFLATSKKLARKMPGRVVGRTVDKNGRECFVLTLQAREQHIRRARATSNICTNQALCSLRAHVYLSLMGKRGLRQLAYDCHARAEFAKERLRRVAGVRVMESAPTFNEFAVELPQNAAEVAGKLVERGFAPGLPLGQYYKDMDNYLLVAVTEMRAKDQILALAENLESVL